MKKLGLITILTILPLCSLAQQDSIKTNLSQKAKQYSQKNRPINLNLKPINQKTINFYDIKLNNKTQYIFPLTKNIEGFTEYFPPQQDWLKNTKQQNIPYIQTGIKFKF